MAGPCSSRPKVLYHGSRALVDVLEPRLARGRGPEKDRLCALYASHERWFALIFALPIVPDDDGGYGVSMSLHEDGPQIVIHAGYLDLSRVGYLYRVPADTFEPVDAFQWVSFGPVTPLGVEVAHPRAYAGWIAEGEVREGG